MHPRDELVSTMDRIYRRGLTTTSGGNLSIRDTDDSIWITPAGIDKGRLSADTIVRVRPDGTTGGTTDATTERRVRPSSELPFHLAAYGARPECRAIVHAHPAAIVAFSVCHVVPDTAVLPLTAGVCGRVASVPYELTGTDRLAGRIADAFAAGADVAILENHGVVVAGLDLREAYQRFEALERTARIIATAGVIGSPRVSSAATGVVAPTARHTVRAPTNETGDEVIAFTRRACRQGLMASAGGLTSARTGDSSFVIVADGADREELGPADLELVDGRASGDDRDRGPMHRLHRAVYDAHPDVNAVITAAPINATAFSVTDVPLDARAVSESLIVLRDVAAIPHDVATGDPARAAAMISAAQPAALLENAGVLTVGRTLHEAFDRLEVLDATAHSLVIARSVGDAVTLGDAEVRELEERFPAG